MIDKERALIELRALGDCFKTVNYDLNEGWIEVKSFPLPKGWNRETTTVRIELPEVCPDGQSPKVYVPDDLRYNGRIPHTMMSVGSDDWFRYALPVIEFDPEHDTMLTVLRLLSKSMKDLGAPNPFK